MRKDAKKELNVTMSRVQGYHATSNYHVSYAFQGWSCNKYFTSDRAIKLDANFNRPDGKPLKGYGLEIETECSTITSDNVYAEMLEKVVFSHFPGGSVQAPARWQPGRLLQRGVYYTGDDARIHPQPVRRI